MEQSVVQYVYDYLQGLGHTIKSETMTLRNIKLMFAIS